MARPKIVCPVPAKELLRHVFGPENYIQRACKVLGVGINSFKKVAYGKQPIPRRWVIVMRNVLPMQDARRERELVRKIKEVRDAYAQQVQRDAEIMALIDEALNSEGGKRSYL